MNEARTLTVFGIAGLVNRLRMLLSGMALAEASGRTFTMIWPRTVACGAAFHDLFVNDWPVVDVDQLNPALLRAAYVPTYSRRRYVDFLVAPERHVVHGGTSWLIFPDRFAAHGVLAARCQELVGKLEPISDIADRVAAFRARHFRPLMIGVHARRGDYTRSRPDRAGNTAKSLAAVDRFLDGMPEAGILLCTDDGAPEPLGRGTRREGVREIFRARYGDRLVETVPSSLVRHEPAAIQDALVDLLLLRVTDAFVGTTGSTFSDFATFGRAVPFVRAGEKSPTYRWVHRAARISGIDWLLRRIVRDTHGMDVPLPVARNVLRSMLSRDRLSRLAARRPRS